MRKTPPPARQRGSSAGKAKKPGPRAEKDLQPACDPDNEISPSQFASLAEEYADVPIAAAKKFIKTRLTGRAIELRLSDIAPPGALKNSFSGETYRLIQESLPKNYTSLDLLKAIYNCNVVPMSTRMEAAEKCLPYEHAKLASPGQQLPSGSAIIVVPGQSSAEDWERVAAEQAARIRKLEESS